MPTSPARALGAPQTTCSGPSPASTDSTCSLSACGCGAAVSTLAITNGVQRVGGVGDVLDLEPDARQRVRHRRGVGGRVEMLLEPAQRELHAPTPPLSVGTSSAAKP